MTLKQSTSPYGYRDLLVYKKAEEIQHACSSLTSHFPHSKTLIALADQMDRSARSVKQNIVEGWKRNSTKEYYEFLGFSLGANAELEEDCNDIIKGIYPALMALKEAVGEGSLDVEEIERLPFYPLDNTLPPVVQLKLRCKEMNLLVSKLQNALLEKMTAEHRMPLVEMQQRTRRKEDDNESYLEKALEQYGLVRLPNGKVVPKGERG